MRKPSDSVIINTSALREKIITGAEQYLRDRGTLDEEGKLIVDEFGTKRAYRIMRYAEQLESDERDNLLALLISIYDPEPPLTFLSLFGFVPGRSNELARLIGNYLIEGEYSLGVRTVKTLTSQVFNKDELFNVAADVKNSSHISCGVSVQSAFKKIYGIRALLRMELNRLSSEKKEELLDIAERLKRDCEKSTSKTPLEVFSVELGVR